MDNILLYISSQDIFPEFHTHISNGLFDSSTWMSDRNSNFMF